MDMDSKLRLLQMAKILYERTDEEHYLSTVELIDLLQEQSGISSHRQTIKRDIEVLQSFGLDIKERKSTRNLYHVVSRLFDIAELRLLIDAVRSAKFITEKKSQELADKISSLAGIHQAQSLKNNCIIEKFPRTDNEKIYLIIDTLNEAINQKRKISFRYFKYSVQKEKLPTNDGLPYVVSPIRLVWNGDYYYLIGIKSNGERRNFRVDRIASPPIILPGEACCDPEDFDINEYLRSTIRMYDGEKRAVKLLCDNSVIDVLIDRFGLDIPIEPVNEQQFETVVPVAVSNVFFGRIFGYGGLIEILEPEDVKEQFKAMLKNFR